MPLICTPPPCEARPIETRPEVLAILANMAKWDADQLLKKQLSKLKRSEAAKKAWSRRRVATGLWLA